METKELENGKVKVVDKLVDEFSLCKSETNGEVQNISSIESNKTVSEAGDPSQSFFSWMNKKRKYRAILFFSQNLALEKKLKFDSIEVENKERDLNTYCISLKLAEENENKLEFELVFEARKESSEATFHIETTVHSPSIVEPSGSLSLTLESNKSNSKKIVFSKPTSIFKFYLDITGFEQRKFVPSQKYPGIVNVGTICYMNSFIQSLNICGFFKKAVFQLKCGEEDTILFAMQKLFYELLTSTTPVNPATLIKSFAWGFEQINEQQDVSEFNMILSDILEKKMKGTKVEGSYEKTFEGKLINTIACLDVDYKSTREEKFSFLTLNIENCNTIYDALDKFCCSETLEGDNMYDAEQHGKQRAVKSMRFLELPSVMNTQLLRIGFNEFGESIKINSRLEYFAELDLKPYTEKEPEDSKYTLHGVIVHNGRVDAGHYYCYMRPTLEDKWYLFNDDVVTEADKSEVFDLSFGGQYKPRKVNEQMRLVNLREAYYEDSAYILIYYKNSTREEMLSPLNLDDIPDYVTNLIKEHQTREKQAKMLSSVEKENIEVNFLTKSLSLKHKGFGVVPTISEWEGFTQLSFENSISIHFPYSFTFLDVKKHICTLLKIKEESIELFLYYNNSGKENYFSKNIGYFKKIAGNDYGLNITRQRNLFGFENLTIYVHFQGECGVKQIENSPEILNCFTPVNERAFIYFDRLNTMKLEIGNNLGSVPSEGKLVFVKSILDGEPTVIDVILAEGNPIESVKKGKYDKELAERISVQKYTVSYCLERSLTNTEIDHKDNLLERIESEEDFQKYASAESFCIFISLDFDSPVRIGLSLENSMISVANKKYLKQCKCPTIDVEVELREFGEIFRINCPAILGSTLGDFKDSVIHELKQLTNVDDSTKVFLDLAQRKFYKRSEITNNLLTERHIFFSSSQEGLVDKLGSEDQPIEYFVDLKELTSSCKLFPIPITDFERNSKLTRILVFYKHSMQKMIVTHFKEDNKISFNLLIPMITDQILKKDDNLRQFDHDNYLIYMLDKKTNIYTTVKTSKARDIPISANKDKEIVIEPKEYAEIEAIADSSKKLVQVVVKHKYEQPALLPFLLLMNIGFTYSDLIEALKNHEFFKKSPELTTTIEKKRFELTKNDSEGQFYFDSPVLNKHSSLENETNFIFDVLSADKGKLSLG